ncbi:MAG: AAA family ATPase [Ignavibacteriales bacterium]|nr:AAA family ATPase [Ignavibacteriales bacterium]
MEKIIVKNFGPIKHVELDLKDVNIFIGPTASGKSTVAKLVSILNEWAYTGETELTKFREQLIGYNINYEINEDTQITYRTSQYEWELSNYQVITTYPFTREFKSSFMMISQLVGSDSFLRDQRTDSTLQNQLIILLSSGEQVFAKPYFQRPEFQKLVDLFNSIKGNFSQETNPIDIHPAQALIVEFNAKFLSIFRRRYISYFPSERAFFSVFADAIYSLLQNKVNIPQSLLKFGETFGIARNHNLSAVIDFFNITYRFVNNQDVVLLDNGEQVPMSESASGFQSVIPMYIVLEHQTSQWLSDTYRFVFEEPELNLYPTNQKKLIEHIVKKVKASNSNLIITTHSPYVLSSIDNLVQAHNVAQKGEKYAEKVRELVPEEYWLDYNRTSCWYFENGTCRSIMNEENKTIGASEIDDVSEEIGTIFENLLDLKYEDGH